MRSYYTCMNDEYIHKKHTVLGIDLCRPSREDSCHGNSCQHKKGQSLCSVLTQYGDYGSFTPTAKTHWRLISWVGLYSSDRYVNIAQTGQVADRNANCSTGWRPCNLNTSCCVLTVNNCFIYRNIIVANSNTAGGILAIGTFSFFFLFPFLFLGVFISFNHFICSQMKKRTFADESLGHSLLPLVSELLTTKTNGQPWQQMLCWGMV